MAEAPPQKKARTDSTTEASKEGTLLPFAATGDVRLLDVPHVREYLPSSANAKYINHIMAAPTAKEGASLHSYNKLLDGNDVILADVKRAADSDGSCRAMLRAGPRRECWFDPAQTSAAVVTCGGLCPGINAVIREIYLTLTHLYGVETVYGIRSGYNGFSGWEALGEDGAPVVLTESFVNLIQHKGGTVLGSSRGGLDVDRVIAVCQKLGISQLYIVGGDGTHRGAHKIYEECRRRELGLVVAGIPKTIDNDLGLIDRSFGFNTAVEEAQRAVLSAKTEAACIPNGIGIVKLMGRSTGLVAAHATLASGDVDLCLVPEVDVVLGGEQGALVHIERMLAEKGHAVVVVSEGAGEEVLGESAETDAGGNRKLPPIGEWLKAQIAAHFAAKGENVNIKYIDPSYMIRSVGANAADRIYCMQSASNAVHGAFAGYTGFSTGLVNNRVVMMPITELTARSPRFLDKHGRTWERVLCSTRQPYIRDCE